MNQYPGRRYPFEKRIPIELKAIDYKRRYSIITYFLFFYTFSIVGWVWEVGYGLYVNGALINRGTLYGPWLPIYGCGGVLILLILKKVFYKPVLTFFLCVLICSIVEYVTSYVLECMKGVKWWDYSGYFLNLNGRICLQGSLAFGIGGVAFIYIFAPLLDNIYRRISLIVRIGLVIVLTALFVMDVIFSYLHPHVGAGITTVHVQLLDLLLDICK